MLTDPRDAFAEHHTLVNALLGLLSVADLVRLLPTVGGPRETGASEPDDFVYLLLGIAGLGARVRDLIPAGEAGEAGTTPPSARSGHVQRPAETHDPRHARRWLR